VIADILKVFLNATGLQINEGKSTIHTMGMEEADLLPFKDLFPYVSSLLTLVSSIWVFFLNRIVTKP
jgi:hypothetical protein